ncbi:GPALPP motifs-containing protein 1 [Scaptodrosophila lebanonensis]|uniref:GPALPP motifs-containing protein 1 n=1 Tax=Drosophila lebanonensis TaxID=7225 RepID=A0A6J2T775_DROLE|nr:GPALPP motifs-containing protein 1 [Scaptodrosophila lebanonensis]
MSSETSSDDSGSSTSSEELRRKRKHKKDKQSVKKLKKSKKHKKEKRQKEKKRAKQKDQEEEKEQRVEAYSTAPQKLSPEPNEESSDAFGPALPPHLRKETPVAMIGPVMPTEFLKQKTDETTCTANPLKTQDIDEDEDEMVDTFGPLPHATQVELEERALTLKLAALEGGGLGSSNVDQDVREEWMLELPEVGLKSGLAALNNMKRTFYQGKERPDFSDRSSWTKTPQSAATAAVAKPCTSKDLEQSAQALYERQRDAEQEAMAKKHKKKHKRDESLVQLHQKKLRKEQRQKEKELAASGSKPERRPFSRDVDLKLNKIDKNQTKQIVDKAKILNTKFSSGQAKYL